MKEKKVREPKMFTPIKGVYLAQITKSRVKLASVVRQNKGAAASLLDGSHKISEEEARKIDAGIEFHNILNAARSVKVYFDMAEMLLENMSEDLKNIETKRKIYEENYLREVHERLQKIQDGMKHKADADRMQKIRDFAKEVQEFN